MALQAVPDRRLGNRSLDLRGVFIFMASQAEAVSGGGNQLHARYVPINADFVATGAPCGDRGVHELPFCFAVVAFQTFRGIGVFFQRYRMNIRANWNYKEEDTDKEAQPDCTITEGIALGFRHCS